MLVIGLVSFYLLWEEAPDIDPAPTARPLSSTADEPSFEDLLGDGEAFETERRDGVYTILFAGNDDGNGNTDTMMFGKIDTIAHTIDFVSIPRDTIINCDWDVRKLNSVYAGSLNSGGNGIDSLETQITRLTGVSVDCYAIIDLDVFIDTIDALGGVYFDVPIDMEYENGVSIHIKKGYQLLDGHQAMGVCRFRSGYITGDYGRIEMQHEFLEACADQFIKLGNIPNVTKVLNILSEGLTTNLSSANIAFFLRQAMMCKPEDINFHTAPSHADLIQGYSYSVLDLYPWLEMINATINPYSSEIGYSDINIVYKDGGSYTSTGSLIGADYYLPPAPQESEPIEEPEPTPSGPNIIIIEPTPVPTPPPAVPTPDPDDGNVIFADNTK